MVGGLQGRIVKERCTEERYATHGIPGAKKKGRATEKGTRVSFHNDAL